MFGCRCRSLFESAPHPRFFHLQGIERFKKVAAVSQGGVLAGEEVFLLWDTFGFPVDLTELMAQEQGLKVDKEGEWRPR